MEFAWLPKFALSVSLLLVAQVVLSPMTTTLAPPGVADKQSVPLNANPPSDPVFLTPTNVQVYANTASQDEPSIAVNPSNPSSIIIGYNDYTTGAGRPGISTTTTGGGMPASWTWRGVLTGGGSLNTLYQPAGDPALAFDSSGNLYYVAMTANGYPGEIFVRRSTDEGATYPTISVISAVTGLTSGHDKPAIAIDRFRTPNRIYVAWADTNFARPGAAWAAIRLAYADVNTWPPASWTLTTTTVAGTAGIVSPTKGCCEGPSVGIGPGGEVYVSYWDSDNSIRISVSTDEGVTFPTLGQIVDDGVVQFPTCTTDSLYNCVPNTATRINTFPYVAVDTSSSAARGDVYVAWADYRNGNGDIWIRRSADGGLTWGAAGQRVNNDVGTADQFMPALAVHPSNGKIFLVFYDRRDDTTTPDKLLNLYFAFALPSNYPAFTNGLVTTAISNPDVLGSWGFMGDYIGAAVSPGSGSTFAVAWTDLRDGSSASMDNNANIYFAQFDPDNGVSLIPWLIVPHNYCWTIISKLRPYICFPFLSGTRFGFPISFWIIGGAISDPVNLTTKGLPKGVSASFSPDMGTPPFMSTVTLTNSTGQGIPSGHYCSEADATNSTGTQRSTAFCFDAMPGAFIVLDHFYAESGDAIVVHGEGFASSKPISLTLNTTQLTVKPQTDVNGTFTAAFKLPTVPDGQQIITADDGTGNKADNMLITPEPLIPGDIAPHTPVATPAFPGMLFLALLMVSTIAAMRGRKRLTKRT